MNDNKIPRYSMDTFQRELEEVILSSSSTIHQQPREGGITMLDIPKSLLQTWLNLPASLRSSLISYEGGGGGDDDDDGDPTNNDDDNNNARTSSRIHKDHSMPFSIDTTTTNTAATTSTKTQSSTNSTMSSNTDLSASRRPPMIERNFQNPDKMPISSLTAPSLLSSSPSSSVTYNDNVNSFSGSHTAIINTTNNPRVGVDSLNNDKTSNHYRQLSKNHTQQSSPKASSSITSASSSACDETGTSLLTLTPLERAPENVFAFMKTHTDEYTQVLKTRSSTVTTTTQVVTTSHGWRNIFHLPISYDITVVPYGTLLDPTNPQLLQSTGIILPEEVYNNNNNNNPRRFAVIDQHVYTIYGDKIHHYFTSKGIELTVCILPGGEADKRPAAVDTLLDQLCLYKLRRREPFLAIGGGVLLDIAGMAACLYRRGVPFVRVPTTLLSIVDASVGVKNGVDYCCSVTHETYKNRIGSFYAPTACLLDKAFIVTQDSRNISNGFGEILKLALVRSIDLFELLESHGQTLIESKLMPTCTVQDGISDRIIDLSIQIMLEELGPNLWETKLDRCVDYGHTFSKLLEMVPGIDIMHGEAVNIDGFFCVVLSYLRGYIDLNTVQRISSCMKCLSLPIYSPCLTAELAWQSCKDALEHRNGEQRIPLITDIGDYICVSDITPEEIGRGLAVLQTLL